MGVVDYLLRRRVKALEDRWEIVETNLTIPSGTLWRSQAHLLDSVQVHEVNGVAWAFSLQIANPLPAGHILRLDLGTDPNSHVSLDPITCPLSVGQTIAVDAGYASFWALGNMSPPPSAFTGYVQIVAAGPGPGDNPTTSDITIVDARAAFLVI